MAEGQLYDCERRALYEEVVASRPSVVLEVGTWKGGGSTLQIVSALTHNGRGHLHTCEVERQFYDAACAVYGGSRRGNITLHYAESTNLIVALLADGVVPDFLFFDGPEDPEVGLRDLRMLEPHLRVGAVFSMHDWLHEMSVKQRLVKPYIEASPNWQIYRTLTPPESVGLVFARKIA